MSQKQKKLLTRILISGSLFVLGLLLPLNEFTRLLLFFATYLTIGYDILRNAFLGILHKQLLDENFLMTIATIGAFFLGQYKEGVSVMLFYQIGSLFQSYAIGRSRKSITELMDICPDFATVKRNGTLMTLDPNDVLKDEVIVIKPGERIPLDGIILKGTSSLNTTDLTGESLPRDVTVDDSVLSGCINLTGVLELRVTSEFAESTVSKILELVEHASTKKSKQENFITTFARYYTPAVVLVALFLAFLAPPLLQQPFSTWTERALIFLVISCPCALVISVPLTFFCAIGNASKNGILIKGSNYMEALSKAEVVVFDKTGTLTKGSFEVSEIHPTFLSKDELLELAALSESYSNHPISLSLRAACKKKLFFNRVRDVIEYSGYGIVAIIDGKKVSVGNEKLMKKQSLTPPSCSTVGTVIHIARDHTYLGYIVISDKVKPQSATAIQSLKELGIRKTIMLTGDSKKAAQSVAASLQLDEFYAELLPGDKVTKVESLLLEKTTGTLCFVGDGTNDAPALTRADVGIAMGGLGSDAAMEAADLVLMDDNPEKIATIISLSKRTMQIVKQNIIFALSIKLLFLILAAFGLSNMWEAVFADVGVSVLAILNAMRAMK